ncbi:MAG: tripartite tricarboxylate transporter substrate binding protein [Betaproteobacteria bacterium]|nr:tripartite tricarboxylate transporter substrate binding protein [Betaproteobacteria bacterium]
MKASHKVLGLLLASVFMFACGGSAAQSYPSKPIRFIVGYPPGGGHDIVARIVSQPLAERLGQQIVVEFKPGADSIIGAEYVAKSPPDGYTLFIAGANVMLLHPGLQERLPYDPAKDFTPIIKLSSYRTVVAVHPSVQANSMKELIALAKAKPGGLFYAWGAADFNVATELFKKQADVNIVPVRYKGTNPSVLAAVAGEVPIVAVSIGPSLAQIRAGKLRALAVSGTKRSALLPDVPTMAESGLPESFNLGFWTALLAPAGTPSAIIEKLYSELSIVLKDDRVKERFASISLEAEGMSGSEMSAALKVDIPKWTKVVKDLNIRTN